MTHHDDLIERVARAMDPLAWVEYGDRAHRAITLAHAKAAIPELLAALAERAEADDLQLDDAEVYDVDDGSHMVSTHLADWLRAQAPTEIAR